jgi:hypothetical protein
MDDTQTAVAAAPPDPETQDGDPVEGQPCRRRQNGEVLMMVHGLPQIVLVFLGVVTLMAFWRLILMICLAGVLTVFALGLMEVAGYVGALR